MSDVQQDSNTWNCLECSVNNDESILLDMDYAAMKKHMQDFHSIDISGKKAQMHLDDADFHLTQYEWTIEGIKLVQSIKVMRQSYKDRMHGQKWIERWPAVLDYIERNRKAIDVEMKRNEV